MWFHKRRDKPEVSNTKKFFLVMLALIACIQLIQPVRNISGQVSPTDISKVYKMPAGVYMTLKNACFDCHSNNTYYPWYAKIQPIGWLVTRDVEKGKDKLNFSEFGLLSKRKQASRLQGIHNSIKDGIMPISYYRLMHKDARLTDEQKRILFEWIEKTQEDLLK